MVIYCKDIQYDENMKKREKKIIKGEKKKMREKAVTERGDRTLY